MAIECRSLNNGGKKASVVTSVGNASRDLRLVSEGITFGFVEEAIKTSSASLGNKEI